MSGNGRAKLTPRQARFVQEYLIDLDAAAAARRAGYAAPNSNVEGSRLLANANIAQQIAKAQAARSERTEIKADQVLKELARLGFADLRNAVEFGPGGVSLKDADELSDDVAAAIESVGETRTKDGGSVRLKLYDKVGALTLLGKHLGMFAERQIIEGGRTPVSVIEIVKHVAAAAGEEPT